MRFDRSGALNANEYNGVVNVNRNSADNLVKSFGNEGGRATDMLKK